MVEEILTTAGIPNKETRFIYPPSETYAVWLDYVTRRGADNALLIAEHSITIEVYAKKIDKVAESNIEAVFAARAIPYEKSEHIWIESEQLFEVVYTFDYIEKRR